MPLQPPQLQLTKREVDVLHLIGKSYKVPEAACWSSAPASPPVGCAVVVSNALKLKRLCG